MVEDISLNNRPPEENVVVEINAAGLEFISFVAGATVTSWTHAAPLEFVAENARQIGRYEGMKVLADYLLRRNGVEGTDGENDHITSLVENWLVGEDQDDELPARVWRDIEPRHIRRAAPDAPLPWSKYAQDKREKWFPRTGVPVDYKDRGLIE